MLSDSQINDLVIKMNLNQFYKGCFYKDEVNQLEENSFYIINLHSHFDENGNINPGSHWVCLCVIENSAMYFDSYGTSPPKHIQTICKKNNIKLGHTKKNIQSLMSDLCGFFCLAFAYYIFAYKKRRNDLVFDSVVFIDLFEDLDKVDDIYKNEYILSLFFTNKDTKEMLLHNNNVITKENQLNPNYDIENSPLRL